MLNFLLMPVALFYLLIQHTETTLTKPELDRIDGIDGIRRNKSERTTPISSRSSSGRQREVISERTTPISSRSSSGRQREVISERTTPISSRSSSRPSSEVISQMRRSASIATERVWTNAAVANSRSTALQQYINSPNNSGMVGYQQQRLINFDACLPKRYGNLFRSKSTDDRNKKGSALAQRKDSPKNCGTYPPDCGTIGAGCSNSSNGAQLSRERSANKSSEEAEEKQSDEQREKAKNGTPTLLKNLLPKAAKSKKSSEEEKPAVKKQNVVDRIIKNLRKAASRKKGGKKKEFDEFSDSSSFRGFPSPDLSILTRTPTWNGHKKSGESSSDRQSAGGGKELEGHSNGELEI